jgi:high-affinity nickel-transport protein
MTTVGGILGLGFVLGLRHALDADHLAAVSTIVSRRRSLWRSALVGVVWGMGHTTSLLAVAVVLIAFHAEIPPAVSRLLELGVAAMLVTLGVRLHVRPAGIADREHEAGHRRPFAVGLVHGLAGSGGLMLAVAATISDPLLAVGYVTVFGIGSIGGMAVTTALFAIPMLATARRFAGADRWLCATAAAASVAVGLQVAWSVGHEAGIFA